MPKRECIAQSISIKKNLTEMLQTDLLSYASPSIYPPIATLLLSDHSFAFLAKKIPSVWQFLHNQSTGIINTTHT